ncbi:MAG: Sensor histidine kinase RcsC [Gammaproteobacteria bacterium]|nr:Sensor histidine kinase RcsC [Gammaproteobacteria bacterium]
MRHEPTRDPICTGGTAAIPADIRREGAAFAVVLLATLALFGYFIWSGYRDAHRVARTTVENLARVIEHELRFTVARADRDLAAAAAMLAGEASRDPSDLHSLLASADLRRGALTETDLGRLAVVAPDRSGWILVDPASGATTPAGPAITEQIDFGGAGGLIVGSPVRGPAGGGLPLLFYRLTRDTAGAVNGAVALILDTGQLERLFRDVDLGGEGAIVLRRVDDDGLLLRRPPFQDPGATAPGTPSYRRIARGEYAGVERYVSPVDGAERIYGFRRVGGYPLYIAVGLATREYLAPWAQRALLSGTAAAVLLVSLVCMLRRRMRSEALLRDSTQALQEAESVSGLAHWEAEAATGGVRWSPNMYRLLGIDPSTPASREAFDGIVHSADRARVHAAWRQAGQGGGFDIEHRIVVGGQVRWVRARARTVKDARGVPVRAFGTVLDTSARKIAEEALAAEHNLLRTILNAIPDYVFLKDEAGVYRLCNSAVERYFGRPEQEIVGRTDFELVDAATAAGFRRDDLVAMAGSEATRREEDLVNPDGSRLCTETIKLPMRGPDGCLIGLLGVARDVTVRRLAELSLIESEARFRSLADSTAVMIWVAGTDGHGTYFNRAWLEFSGRTLEAEVAEDWRRDMHPDDLDSAQAGYRDGFRSGEDFSVEYRRRRHDGVWRWVLDAGRARYTAEGVLCGFIGSCLDISERRHLQMQDSSRAAILEMVARGESLGVVLDRIASSVEKMDPDVRCSILLLDDSGRRLLHGAAPSLPAFYSEAIDGIEIGPECGSCGSAAHRRELLVVEDVRTHPYWAPYRDLAARAGIVACWSMPIFGSDGVVLGTFALYYAAPRRPGEADLALIALKSRLAGIAIERVRTERALAESEQKYRNLLDEMADGVWVVQDYRLVIVNAALAALLGYRREELIGMPLAEVVAPDFRDLVVGRYEHRVNSEEDPPRRYEVRLSRRDGTEMWAELIASRMLFNGRPSALVIVRDNTERRHAEQFLRDVIESTSDGILVEDRSGNALVTNRCFQDMWNIPAAVPESGGHRALHDYVQAQLATNTDPPAKTADLRPQDQWRDYHLLQVGDGRLIARYSSPLLRDGVVAGRVWSFRDVTERRKTEILYRSVIESSPDAFVAVDEDGRIVDWSPRAEQLFGWPAGEVMGRSLHETIVPPAYRDLHVEGMRRFLRGGEPRIIGRVMRMAALRRGGQEFPVELQVSVVRIGSRCRFTSFIRDISGRVLAEQQLAQAQRMEAIGQLTGGLAHDFNNMLGIIVGSLDLLSLEQTDAEARELIGTAMSAAHRGVEVTKSLLAVARRQALAPKVVEIDTALTEMEPLLRQTAGKRVEVRLERGVSGMCAYVDPGSFNNAVLNTVINARDAMPAGGELRIGTALINAADTHLAADLDPGTYIEVRIEDTGCGMPPEAIERAFDPFFTTKERGKGTGLGLAMVYGFARQSGGVATIRSTVGRGTCVRLVLPVAATPARQDEAVAAPGDRPVARAGETVLVVDDEFDLRRIIREWLVGAGYRVALADSPAEALRRLQAERFDLMLTDVVMPGPMDGAVLARTVMRQHPGTRVLLMSGFADDALGGVKQQWAVLEKPFRRDELARAVRRELDQRDAQPA